MPVRNMGYGQANNLSWAPWHWPPLPGKGGQGSGNARPSKPWGQPQARQDRRGSRTDRWRPWTACSCGRWYYDDRNICYCTGCGAYIKKDKDRQKEEAEQPQQDVKLEVGDDKKEAWSTLVALARSSLGGEAAALLEELVAKPGAATTPATGAQAGKAFTAARVAREKADNNKSRAAKEVAKLEEELSQAREVLQDATEKAAEAAKNLQEAIDNLGKHFGNSMVQGRAEGQVEEEEDPFGEAEEDDEAKAIQQRMAAAKAAMDKEKEALRALARKKAAMQVDQEEKAKRARDEAEAGASAAKQARKMAEGQARG